MIGSIGERFARALAEKDAALLKTLMRPEVDFRAMTPAKFWEATDRDAVIDTTILGTWFPAERAITEILDVTTDGVGPLERITYRFKVTRPDGEFVVEQQAYLRTADGQITWLRVMCTGFLPI